MIRICKNILKIMAIGILVKLPNYTFNHLFIEDSLNNNDEITIGISLNARTYEKAKAKQVFSSKQEKRDFNQTYFSALTQSFANKWNIHNFYCSRYSPFLFLNTTFNSFKNNFEMQKKLKKISKNQMVEQVSVEKKVSFASQSLELSSQDNSNLYTPTELKSVLGLSNCTKTGSGVTVAVFDRGAFDSTIIPLNKVQNDEISVVHEHATMSAGIIGGNSGIAPDVNFLCYLDVTLHLTLETAIDEGADIINMCSASEANLLDGFYSTTSKYIDYICSINDLIVVCAAGNYESQISSNYNLMNPAIAANTIAVGSCNKDKYFSYFSKYVVDSSYNSNLLKGVDCVAIGENIHLMTQGSYSSGHSGTSNAAPFVSGILALLGEEFPFLLSSPVLVKRMIQSSCLRLVGQEDNWQEECGYGLINYEKCRTFLQNYTCSIINTNGSTSGKVLEQSLFLPSHCNINLEIFTNFNPGECSGPLWGGSTIVTSISNNNYVYKVLDLATNTYVTEGNFDCLSCNLSFSIGCISLLNAFKIEVFCYNFIEGAAHQFLLKYSVENVSHAYSSVYEWLSLSEHKAYCDCGQSVVRGHLLGPSIPGSSNLFLCLQCGGRARTGFIHNSEDFILNNDDCYYSSSTRQIEGNIFLSFDDYNLFKETVDA